VPDRAIRAPVLFVGMREPYEPEADPRPVHAPSPAGTPLLTTDGIRIDARHDAGHGAARGGLCVVVAHGFTGSWRRPAVRRVAALLRAVGGVVSFDFRGHGRSGGVSTVGDQEVHDVEAALGWARLLGYRRLVTLGFSMGASVVVRHAALCGGVDAVAAVSGPSRWYYRGTPQMRRVHWVIERRLGRLVGRFVLRTRVSSTSWDPLPEAPHEVAARIAPAPLLVVHGDADPYFPVEHAIGLYAAAAEPKELWIEPGFAHAENAARDELIRRIGDWLGRRAPPRPDLASDSRRDGLDPPE
jgi:pimeloyl-ACP methyl ester carboxylesterase